MAEEEGKTTGVNDGIIIGALGATMVALLMAGCVGFGTFVYVTFASELDRQAEFEREIATDICDSKLYKVRREHCEQLSEHYREINNLWSECLDEIGRDCTSLDRAMSTARYNKNTCDY